MNKNRKRTMIIIVLAYILVILLFFGSVFYIPLYYNNLQNDYISDTQEQLSNAFATNTSTEALTAELDGIVEQYPMELIVFKDGINIYNTMIPVPGTLSLHESLDQRVTLSQGSGSFIENGSTYQIWYNVYQVQIQPFLFHITALQIVLLGIATIILITAVVVFQRLMVHSMETLKKTIGKMEKYELDEVMNAQSDDVINSKIKYFARGLRENISRTAQKEVELQQEAYINKEQFIKTQMISRAFIHELKTPIYQTLLENESWLEQLKADDRESRMIAEYNIQQADSLLQAINDMLRLFSDDKQNIVLAQEAVDLTAIISEVRKTFVASIREHQVVLAIEVPEHLMITSNKAMVKLLIHNVLSNAIQYSIPESEIQVALYTDISGRAVFACTNYASDEHIERLLGDTEVQSFIGQNNKYSSGNGLILINSLAHSLDAEYSRRVDANQVCIQIVFTGGEYDD